MVCAHCLATKQLPSLLLIPAASLGAVGVLTLCIPAGTNEQAIIDVLTKRSNAQRQQIAKSFKAQFGKVKVGLESGLLGVGVGRYFCGQRQPGWWLGEELHPGQGPWLEASF